MVVLSAALVTKNGKILLARQFVEMTRIRIEGLIAAFPKLLGSGSKQHTYIETESVRYVYQPLEQLFLVLVTNKASNIIQDLDTVRLLSKAVPDVASGLTEEKIVDKCFELIFAFDEVITTGGYREQIALPQIRTNMEMDSHEEKLHKMIQKTKMENAKEESARQARNIRDRQKEQAKMDKAGMGGIAGGMAGIGSGPASSADVPLQDPSFTSPPPQAEPINVRRANPVKGMALGGLGKKTTMLDSLVAEDNLAPVPVSRNVAAAAQAGLPPPPPVPSTTYPLTVVAEERLSAKLTREGAVESMELKGTLQVTASTEAAAKAKLFLRVDESGQFTYQPHPKIDRPGFDSNRQLILKDTSKGFPVDRSIGLLRWSMASSDARVPLSINCWPEEEGRGNMSVAIEYSLEKNIRLHDVAITIPLGTTEPPKIQSIDGSSKHNSRDGTLVWLIDMIDNSNRSGSLEFNIPCRDAEAFFPLSVSFASTDLYCSCEILKVLNADDDTPVQYGITTQLATEQYQVD